MRLLNVHSGRLEQFYGSQIPPYAILSHTWGSTEITFSDIQTETPTTLSSSSSPFPPVVSNFSDIETQAPWAPNPKNLRMRPKFSNTEAQSPSEPFEFPFEPLPPIFPAPSLASDIESRPEYAKIRYTRNQAIADRLDYVWVDTCCIDKSSSAELSEAINSMFVWYQRASTCYAYLEDVIRERMLRKGAVRGFKASRWFTRGTVHSFIKVSECQC
jgi:hypothetical protein